MRYTRKPYREVYTKQEPPGARYGILQDLGRPDEIGSWMATSEWTQGYNTMRTIRAVLYEDDSEWWGTSADNIFRIRRTKGG